MSGSNGSYPQDFVSLFLYITRKGESPSSFWRWSAYAGVAAILRNNVYHKWGSTRIYPNIYVLLLADSAVSRKDAGPSLIEELLREVGHTKVISGRASWQGICDELSLDIGNKRTGIPLKGGSCLIVAPELSAFFVSDPQLIPMITDGYAYSEEHQYTLRGGKVTIKHRCISMLSASNEILLKDVYDARASEGGLLRRTFVVKADEIRPPNTLMEDDDHISDAEKKELIRVLNNLKQLQGEIQKTDDAKNLYMGWYKDIYSKYTDTNDRTGFYYGIHALVFKLAIIIACAHNSLCITESMMNDAIAQVENLRSNYTDFTIRSGKNPQTEVAAVLINWMWGSKVPVKRREILFKYWNEISSEDLDKLLMTLESAGVIRMNPSGTEPAYELTQKARESYLKDAKTKSNRVN